MPQCFVKNCKTGYKSQRDKDKKNGRRHPSVFKAPEDLFTLEKWRQAVPRRDRLLTQKDRLCELHFDESCIERHFKTILPDGTIHLLHRKVPLLKEGSIPTKFDLAEAGKSSSNKKLRVQTYEIKKKPRTYEIKNQTCDKFSDVFSTSATPHIHRFSIKTEDEAEVSGTIGFNEQTGETDFSSSSDDHRKMEDDHRSNYSVRTELDIEKFLSIEFHSNDKEDAILPD